MAIKIVFAVFINGVLIYTTAILYRKSLAMLFVVRTEEAKCGEQSRMGSSCCH